MFAFYLQMVKNGFSFFSLQNYIHIYHSRLFFMKLNKLLSLQYMKNIAPTLLVCSHKKRTLFKLKQIRRKENSLV